MINKLASIQKNISVPKGQYNDFGKYKYRSCEDIYAAVKPLLNGLVLTVTDEMVNIGERYYIKATAKLIDGKGGAFEVVGYARECLSKKGMDESQITGSASSYARKYALNGMFCLDDVKDADTNEHQSEVDSTPKWYNDFDIQKEAMKKKIASGEQTPQGIIDSLKKSGFAISKKTQTLILQLEGENQ